MSGLDRRFFTGTALAVAGAIFVALVVLSGLLLRGARIDLTEDRLYTLSSGTRAILERIDEPVNLYFFYSDGAASSLPMLETYATRVRELLEEMAAESDGMVRLEVIDPVPFSEAEDRATAFGLTAAPIGPGGAAVFFGLAGTNATDGVAAIPFFDPQKETFLEYDVAKLIHSLVVTDRPVVGLISSLQIGPGFDPATRAPRQGWVIHDELQQLFDLRNLGTEVTLVDDAVDVLMLVHPRGLDDETLYAIDQFVLRGGRLVALVDPNAEAQQPAPGMDPQMAMFEPKSSDLQRLFRAWGVRYDPDRVVLDAGNALVVRGADGQPQRHPAVLGLGREDLNQDDVVSAEIAPVNLSTAGHFELAEGAGAKLEPLAQSSTAAATVAAERVRFLPDPGSLFADFTATGQPYVLAARLTGPLKTAFPERSGDGHLAESSEDANLILIADTDLLADRMWVEVQSFFGQRLFNAFAKNGDFVVNAVDNLTGSSELISVRARRSSARPFDTVEALRRQADERLRETERELQAELAETERKLGELQAAKGEDGALILSPEQQAELQRFQDERARVRKELRQVRRQLDADIAALGTWLKFWNIAAIPLLLTLAALGFLWWRLRRRRAARTESDR